MLNNQVILRKFNELTFSLYFPGKFYQDHNQVENLFKVWDQTDVQKHVQQSIDH